MVRLCKEDGDEEIAKAFAGMGTKKNTSAKTTTAQIKVNIENDMKKNHRRRRICI